MGEIEEVTKKVLNIERMSGDLERMDTRFEALKQQIQFEAEQRQDKFAAELQVLETLVKQLAEKMTYEGKGAVRVKAPVIRDEPVESARAGAAADNSPEAYVADAAEPASSWNADDLEAV